MNRRTWQRVETRTAKDLAGIRNALGAAGADVDAGAFVVECKARTQPAGYVAAALEQAEAAAKPGQTALARLHTKGQRADDDLAVMRWSSLLALLAEFQLT